MTGRRSRRDNAADQSYWKDYSITRYFLNNYKYVHIAISLQISTSNLSCSGRLRRTTTFCGDSQVGPCDLPAAQLPEEILEHMMIAETGAIPADEERRMPVAGPFHRLVESICGICTSSVQFRHHLTESEVGDGSCEAANPTPALGRGVYFKRTVYWLVGEHLSDGFC